HACPDSTLFRSQRDLMPPVPSRPTYVFADLKAPDESGACLLVVDSASAAVGDGAPAARAVQQRPFHGVDSAPFRMLERMAWTISIRRAVGAEMGWTPRSHFETVIMWTPTSSANWRCDSPSSWRICAMRSGVIIGPSRDRVVCTSRRSPTCPTARYRSRCVLEAGSARPRPWSFRERGPHERRILRCDPIL